MAPRFRADHSGSLLRPAALPEARAAYADGRLRAEALRQAEDSAVLEAIRLQRDVGLGIFTDGEYRRGSWLTDLAEAVEGFVPDRVLLEWHGPGGGQEASSARVVGGPLHQQRRLTAHELAFLKAHAPGPINWYAQGGYEPVAERLFTEIAVDTLLLEDDSKRAGGFEPLRFVPTGKTVVLGLVTTKEPRLESSDALRHRLDEAARYVPLENLALSPQCGFASVAAGNLLSWDEQRRKLELVVDTAQKVWG
jgi:methionine synthase II (cobalamin-independent)